MKEKIKTTNLSAGKKKYIRPQLHKIGSVSQITLKTGSQSDFGSNFFQA